MDIDQFIDKRDLWISHRLTFNQDHVRLVIIVYHDGDNLPHYETDKSSFYV